MVALMTPPKGQDSTWVARRGKVWIITAMLFLLLGSFSSRTHGLAPLTSQAQVCQERLFEYASSLPSTGQLWKMTAASSVFSCSGRDSQLDPLVAQGRAAVKPLVNSALNAAASQAGLGSSFSSASPNVTSALGLTLLSMPAWAAYPACGASR